jgi:hypothetical protein
MTTSARIHADPDLPVRNGDSGISVAAWSRFSRPAGRCGGVRVRWEDSSIAELAYRLAELRLTVASHTG